MKQTLTPTVKANRYYPHRELRKFWRIVFIVIIATLFYFHSMAQTTEDGYLKVVYMGNSGGTYKVKITNKQSCKADISFMFKGSATAISPNWKNNINHNEIPALSTCVYTITGTLTEIKIKALSICNWAGQAPIWLTLDNRALPVAIKDIRITVIKN